MWYNAPRYRRSYSEPTRRRKMQLSRNHKLSFTIHPHPQHPGARGCPKNTKRTQLPSKPPIYILQSTIYNPLAQFAPGQQPKANGQHPKKAKRTQFHPGLSSRATGCGAKRSGPKSRDLPKHHRQRRFQSNKPRSQPKIQNEPCAKLSWCSPAGVILPGQRSAARPE